MLPEPTESGGGGMGGWGFFKRVWDFDVGNFQQGFSYIVPGTEYRVLILVF